MEISDQSTEVCIPGGKITTDEQFDAIMAMLSSIALACVNDHDGALDNMGNAAEEWMKIQKSRKNDDTSIME